jgi:hypothetical protein
MAKCEVILNFRPSLSFSGVVTSKFYNSVLTNIGLAVTGSTLAGLLSFRIFRKKFVKR